MAESQNNRQSFVKTEPLELFVSKVRAMRVQGIPSRNGANFGHKEPNSRFFTNQHMAGGQNMETTTNNNLSAFSIIKKAFWDTNAHFTSLIWDINFALFLTICTFVPMWLWYVNLWGPDDLMVKMFQIMMVFSCYVMSLFMTSLFLSNKTRPATEEPLTFWQFTKNTTYPWTVEGLKATGIILAGLIVFVIPGIIKYVQYMFFSFVVFFNRDYKEGKINCLKHSKKLSKGLGWWLFGLFFLLPHFIGEIPNQMGKLVFGHIDSKLIIYPVLIASLHVMCVIITYLFSMMYFMYVTKERENI